MAVFAVFGCTGQVGSSVLDLLLKSPDSTIHAYVRSRQKLYAMRPQLETATNVRVFEGSLEDTDLLTDVIHGTQAVFMAAAASDNVPGCTVARNQAEGVVRALEQLRKEPDSKLPRLVILSSASLNRELNKDFPTPAYYLLHMAASYVYHDLEQAEHFLRSHDWIKQVYIKPGGLVHDKPRGHVLDTERQETFLSFIDLAAGMVEVGQEGSDKWNLQNVSVRPASPGTKIEWRVPLFLMKGLLYHFLPFTYPYLQPWLPA